MNGNSGNLCLKCSEEENGNAVATYMGQCVKESEKVACELDTNVGCTQCF